MTSMFNFNRMGLLIQRYFVENRNRECYYWGMLAIAFMFLRNQPEAVGSLIIIMGMIFCARSFSEIHSPVSGMKYFMIPATQAEKMTVTAFLSIVYYFGMMLVVYTIGNLLGTFLNNMLANIGYFASGFEIFSHKTLQWCLFENVGTIAGFKGNFSGAPLIWTYFKSYLFVQAIFTLGSLYFKRTVFFKTVLALFVTALVCAIIMGLSMKGLFNFPSDASIQLSINAGNNPFGQFFGSIAYILIPYLWVLGYFKLTEKEV